MIAVAGKPVVGHNCLLDFCFTIAQFREELPDTLPAFKKSLKRFWHTVVDTKHIATMDPSVREMIGLEGSTILGPLYEQTLGNGFENAPSIGAKIDDERPFGFSLC
ncbi:MAG: hypothetical protein BJ554DRAFT_2789 [Olpidium bornovanus]|uniref:Uncharacterized protein n=1 Tax=Olpidium bornovanus TaxID=278681 RepID=A0A8H8DG57_9FUNG|nr:MAG: hypothetical protein BJ554DRAFT_2789 [Olpidium bornovanus]